MTTMWAVGGWGRQAAIALLRKGTQISPRLDQPILHAIVAKMTGKPSCLCVCIMGPGIRKTDLFIRSVAAKVPHASVLRFTTGSAQSCGSVEYSVQSIPTHPGDLYLAVVLYASIGYKYPALCPSYTRPSFLPQALFAIYVN